MREIALTQRRMFEQTTRSDATRGAPSRRGDATGDAPCSDQRARVTRRETAERGAARYRIGRVAFPFIFMYYDLELVGCWSPTAGAWRGSGRQVANETTWSWTRVLAVTADGIYLVLYILLYETLDLWWLSVSHRSSECLIRQRRRLPAPPSYPQTPQSVGTSPGLCSGPAGCAMGSLVVNKK